MPEDRLDRFMLRIPLDFPNRDAERQMLLQTTGATTAHAPTLMNATTLLAAQKLVRRLPVGDKIVDAILALTRSLRPEDSSASSDVRDAVSFGPGPRAAQALMIATRARALLNGRLAPSLDDVVALAEPVLSHRIRLGFGARASGVTVEALIRKQAQTIL